MRETINLCSALYRKEYILLREYPIETISTIGTMYLIFLMLYYGGGALTGLNLENQLGAVIVGYFLLLMGTTSYQGITIAITEEAQWGTLERLIISPFGFGRVTILMALTKITTSFIWGASILILMMVTTQMHMSLDLISMIVILFFSLTSTLGLGLFAGGVAVRYKRVGSLFRLLGLVFVILVAAPATKYPLLKLLPLVQGSYLLRRVMDGGVHIWNLPFSSIVILIGVGITYFGIGYLSLQYFLRKAKDSGVLGHY